jgi:hypothetical protein
LSDIFLEGKGKCEVDTTKEINVKYDLKIDTTKEINVKYDLKIDTMFCGSLIILFLLAIVLSVFLRITASDYPFDIFELFS